jgi:UDP-2-acetamido-3-amino-2,3-dideoxy-glucuronate N-acetyltransferase
MAFSSKRYLISYHLSVNNRAMIASDVILGSNVKIFQPDLVNLYGCRIGDGTRVGPFVEVQRGASIGANCKISSHTFICAGVTIEDGVFVGHGVMFINDIYPSAVNADGTLQMESDWKLIETRIKKHCSLGSNCTIVGGIVVGEQAMVGAGAVVTHDVPDFAIVVGVPARVIGDVRERKSSASNRR